MNPETLKAGMKHSLKFIAMGLARRGDGKLFLAGSDFKVYQADAGAKVELKEIGAHESYVTSAAVAGNTLITSSYDQQVTWWDTAKGAKIRSVKAHTRWGRQVTVSPNGKWVSSVGDDMVCKVFEVETGKLVHTLTGHEERTPTHFPSMLFTSTFSADNKYLATADKVGKIIVWDVQSGKEVKSLTAPGFYTWDGRHRIHSIGGIRSLAFSPDGKLLAAGGIAQIGNVDHLDASARIEVFEWQSDAKSVLFDKSKFKGLVNRLTFGPEGKWLLGSGGAGSGFLIFVDVAKKKVIKEEAVTFHVHGMALTEKSDSIIVAGHNGLASFELKA